MPKILFVATVVKIHIAVFHLPYIRMMKELGWETAVAAKNDYDAGEECVIPYCDHYYDIPFARSPFSRDNMTALKQLEEIIDREQFDIIHCNTPVGGVIGRMAARKARKNGAKVYYTAHGFHFFDGAPLKNWLLYYPVEKHFAKDTDTLITINEEDYKRAVAFKRCDVRLIPGIGIDTRKFADVTVDVKAKKQELGLSADDLVILSVGEMTVRKNHEEVIRALAELKDEPLYSRIHYLVCGNGALKEYLEKLASELGISDHVHLLGFRYDVQEILQAADLFVFMSRQEGLPVAVMEAMAAGRPVIASDIRGNHDLIRDGENGWLIRKGRDSLSARILQVLSSPEEAAAAGQKAQQGMKEYDIANVMKIMKEIYGLAPENDR
ncbi:MAG: glycosyltransferase family 4 protein [Solobacterium sp.]|nr:glycosyltransferase family 4 protein [Solobacterium sp.]